jgi:hypothetical protein
MPGPFCLPTMGGTQGLRPTEVLLGCKGAMPALVNPYRLAEVGFYRLNHSGNLTCMYKVLYEYEAKLRSRGSGRRCLENWYPIHSTSCVATVRATGTYY